MPQYASLHNHGVYSFLDGLARYPAYAKRAKELGLAALATTEHGNVHGHVEFWDACRAEGVKPILGMEGYQSRKTRFDRDPEELSGKAVAEFEQRGPYHLTVLARNDAGYRNLIKLSSRSYLEGFYGKPRFDRELLAEHGDGLIILSGCLGGEVCQALLRGDERHALEAAAFFRDAVGPGHFYLELMDHGIPEEKQVQAGLLEISRALDVPVVATADCHYVHCAEAAAHDLMLCVSVKARLDAETRFRFTGEQFFLHHYDEMARLFEPAWLSSSLAVAESVEFDFESRFGEAHFPEFPLPEGEPDLAQLFERQVHEGARRRYGDSLPEAVQDRVDYELRVIAKMGFQSYFLIVADLVRWAKEQGIPVGPGRGSAAASICSYSLGITRLDPLRFGLPFERFLVEGRKSPPDIDLDFDDRQRDRVVQYAREKYGDERVAHICTFTTIQARLAIKDAARALGHDFLASDKINKLLPPPVFGVSKSIDESLAFSPDFAREYRSSAQCREIVDAARHLEGLVRQPGVHPAGVVIAPGPVADFLPVMRRKEGAVVTQWDMGAVERSGQLKIDFLGLRNLGVIDHCLQMVTARHGVEIDLDQLPLDDEVTYRMLCDGNSLGVFQLEGSGMRELMVALQPERIEDLMALVALYRPGPLGAGVHKLFIGRKHGRLPVAYDHPKMADLLADSYGLLLYQEGILIVARSLAGFSAAEADDLRKAVSKKLMDKIPLYRAAFVAGCAEVSGVEAKVANKIYSDIEHFGAYGFAKPHAAAYALVAFQTAYLKAHYPTEYMAALLASVDDKKEKTAVYLHECRRLGIRVYPPDVNRSERGFSVLPDNEILFGLLSIDGVGPAVIEPLLAARGEPFRGLHDFLRRCPPQTLDKSILERLAAAGALDCLVEGRPDRPITRSERMELLEMERKTLTSYVTEHPLTGVWPGLASQVEYTVEALGTAESGQRVRLGGLVTGIARRTTKKGDAMCSFNLEDLTGMVEVVVFPRDYRRVGESLVEGDVLFVEAKLTREGDESSTVKLVLSSLSRPELPENIEDLPLRLHLEGPPAEAVLARLLEVAAAQPGSTAVELEIPEGRFLLVCRLPVTTSASIEALEAVLS